MTDPAPQSVVYREGPTSEIFPGHSRLIWVPDDLPEWVNTLSDDDTDPARIFCGCGQHVAAFKQVAPEHRPTLLDRTHTFVIQAGRELIAACPNALTEQDRPG